MTEWREVTIEELAEKIAMGPFGSDIKVETFKPCGVPIISGKHLHETRMRDKGFNFISEEHADKLSNANVFRGDVIFTHAGNIGQVSFIPENSKYERYVISQRQFYLRCNSNVLDYEFIAYYFKSPYGQYQLLANANQTGVPSLAQPVSYLKSIKVLLPPLPEQKAIADVLSSLDDKIDLLTRQNKTLEDLAQAYFRKWFIEDASDEWEVGKLGDYIEIHDSKRVPLSKIEREKMKSGTLYPYYGAATIMDYVNDYIFDGEYILMGEDGTVETEDGYPVLQYATGKFWVNNHAHVLTAKSPFNNYFIWFFLKQCNISGIVTGAVQPKINQENLKNIDIPIPDLTLINSANQFFANIFAKILNNLEQIKTFQKLRDTLLPKLISGEIRLKM